VCQATCHATLDDMLLRHVVADMFDMFIVYAVYYMSEQTVSQTCIVGLFATAFSSLPLMERLSKVG